MDLVSKIFKNFRGGRDTLEAPEFPPVPSSLATRPGRGSRMGGRWRAAACATTLLLLALAPAKTAAGIGFCILGTQPAALQGTGYAETSTLTEAECIASPLDEWCPLKDETKTFEYTDPDTGAVTTHDYYWWSACCTGMQGDRLIVDSTAGMPTCKAGSSADSCARGVWHGKLYTDLLGPAAGYNVQIAPGQSIIDANVYGGIMTGGADDAVGCKCTNDDPGCLTRGGSMTDGEDCLVCETERPCSPDARVEMSLSFFKITQVNFTFPFSASLDTGWVPAFPKLAG